MCLRFGILILSVFISFSAAALSQFKGIGICVHRITLNNLRIHSISLTAVAVETNSASAVDWATIDCSLERHMMGESSTVSRNSEVLFLNTRSAAKSASVYAATLKPAARLSVSARPGKKIPVAVDLASYGSTFFAALRCGTRGQDINRLSTPTA